MYQSNRSFNIPTGNNPPGIWTFEDWLVQIPSPRGKKAVQMPHKLVLKCLFSKANFVYNQTLFTLFRERSAVMTPSNFSLRPFWKSNWQTKAKLYLVNLSNPAKTKKKKKTHGHITLKQEINLVQILHPSKATFKFPPPQARCTVKCPGYAWGGGGGMLKLQFNRYISPVSPNIKELINNKKEHRAEFSKSK